VILVCKYQHPEALCCHMADLPYINMDLWSCTSTTSHLASTHINEQWTNMTGEGWLGRFKDSILFWAIMKMKDGQTHTSQDNKSHLKLVLCIHLPFYLLRHQIFHHVYFHMLCCFLKFEGVNRGNLIKISYCNMLRSPRIVLCSVVFRRCI
jgi:hypothetical protein